MNSTVAMGGEDNNDDEDYFSSRSDQQSNKSWGEGSCRYKICLKNNDTRAMKQLGRLYIREKDFERAIEPLSTAFDITKKQDKPSTAQECEEILQLLILALKESQRFEEAIRRYDDLIQVILSQILEEEDPKLERVYISKGNFLKHSCDYERALQAYMLASTACLSRDPSHNLFLKIAKCHQKLRNYDRACFSLR